jgi:hypothetical protein
MGSRSVYNIESRKEAVSCQDQVLPRVVICNNIYKLPRLALPYCTVHYHLTGFHSGTELQLFRRAGYGRRDYLGWQPTSFAQSHRTELPREASHYHFFLRLDKLQDNMKQRFSSLDVKVTEILFPLSTTR